MEIGNDYICLSKWDRGIIMSSHEKAAYNKAFWLI